MLIPSPRHRPDDLRLWLQYEHIDMLHASRAEHVRRVEQAVNELCEFLLCNDAYISFSGGKDSACVVGIADEGAMLKRLPIVWFRDVLTANPNVPEVIDYCRRRFPDAQWNTIDFDRRGEGNYADEMGPAWRAACAEAERRFGKRVIGVRGDESSMRQFSLARHGASTSNSCRPIVRWSNADVFAFAAANDIPLHPAYAMLGGGRWERQHLRVEAMLGSGGARIGRAEWEREYYGDVLRRIEAS